MRPLEKVYWLRLVLGVVAAVICASYAIAANEIPQVNLAEPFPQNTSLFFNSASVAIVVYLLSYYVVKFKFQSLVQKPQKLITTGIGIYVLSWLVFWALLYTMLVRLV